MALRCITSKHVVKRIQALSSGQEERGCHEEGGEGHLRPEEAQRGAGCDLRREVVAAHGGDEEGAFGIGLKVRHRQFRFVAEGSAENKQTKCLCTKGHVG